MVSPRMHRRRALDLHPPEAPARIHHKVVALAVAPRLRHLKSQPHRLVQKRRLRYFPGTLRIASLLYPVVFP